jgi:hypothetical protein
MTNYFITSEQFVPSQGPAQPRKYTIREVSASGDVDTVGELLQFATLKQAKAAIP